MTTRNDLLNAINELDAAAKAAIDKLNADPKKAIDALHANVDNELNQWTRMIIALSTAAKRMSDANQLDASERDALDKLAVSVKELIEAITTSPSSDEWMDRLDALRAAVKNTIGVLDVE